MSLTTVTKHISDQIDELLVLDQRIWKAYDLIEQLAKDETLTEEQHNLALDALNLLETV